MKNTGKRIFAFALVGLVLTGCGVIPATGTAGDRAAACQFYRDSLAANTAGRGALIDYWGAKADQCRQAGY